MQKYVANLAFEEYEAGEILEAEPSMVADWLENRFISLVDERGDRIVEHESDGATAAMVDAPPVDAPPVDAPDTTATTRGSRAGSTDDAA